MRKKSFNKGELVLKTRLNKNKKRILVLFTVIIMVSLFLVMVIPQSPDIFSEKKHIERISKLVEKRYINDSDKYTGYKVYPLYNESDELAYFLIELEPSGFVYVKMNESYLIFRMFGGNSMYTRSDAIESKTWQRYRIRGEGSLPLPQDRLWKIEEADDYGRIYYPNRRWEIDENGDFIHYDVSHFKAANIEGEKRYLLRIKQSSSSGYIPAVKRGDKYLNLISMEEMRYELAMASQVVTADEYPCISMQFLPKKMLDL